MRFIFLFYVLLLVSTQALAESNLELFELDRMALFNKYKEYKSTQVQPDGQWLPKAQIDLLTRTPFTADRNIYFIVGFMESRTGDVSIAKLKIGRTLRHFAFTDAIETPRGKAANSMLRQNDGLGIIGRLVDVKKIKNKLGVEQLVPIFEALHVELCSPRELDGVFWCHISGTPKP